LEDARLNSRHDAKVRHAVKKEVLQTWPPRIRPQMFERGHDAGGGENVDLPLPDLPTI
jgi:hypothetical protein